MECTSLGFCVAARKRALSDAPTAAEVFGYPKHAGWDATVSLSDGKKVQAGCMDVAPTVSVAGTRTARKLSRGKLLSRRWSLTVEFDRLRTFPTGRIMRPKEEAIEVGAWLAAAWRGPLIMPRSCKISGDAMKRRDFIWLLGTSAIWATESGAQQPLRTIALIGNTPAAFGPWQRRGLNFDKLPFDRERADVSPCTEWAAIGSSAGIAV